MTISDNLFLSISTVLGMRVTPENLRTKFDEISSNGGITSRVKTRLLLEMLLAVTELEKKIDEK